MSEAIILTPGWAAVLLTAGANIVLVVIFLGRMIFASKADLGETNKVVARHEERLDSGMGIFVRMETAIHENTNVTSELSCQVAELRGALRKPNA